MSTIEFFRLALLVDCLGERTAVSSWLGLVCGTAGIFYGLRAKTFTAYGRFTGREPQIFAPTRVHRVLVVAISGAAAITSLVFIAKNW